MPLVRHPGRLHRGPEPRPHEGRQAVHGVQPVPACVDPAGAPPGRCGRPARSSCRRAPGSGGCRPWRRSGSTTRPTLLDRPPASEAEAQRAAKHWVRSKVARLRDVAQHAGRRHLAPVGAPAVRDAVAPVARGARPRRRRRRGRRVPLRARLARLLRRGPAAPPGGRPDRVPGALPGHAGVGRRPGRARGLEGGRDRLSRRGRRHAPAARHGLDAQPGADDRRLVPREGPPSRLAARRGALHGAPARRRRRLQQRRLAVGRLDGHGSRTVFPAALQSDPAAGALRPGRSLRAALDPGALRRPRRQAR